MNQVVDLLRGHSGPDTGLHEIEGLQNQTPGSSDSFDIGRIFKADTVAREVKGLEVGTLLPREATLLVLESAPAGTGIISPCLDVLAILHENYPCRVVVTGLKLPRRGFAHFVKGTRWESALASPQR
jgi:hypothetical protein